MSDHDHGDHHHDRGHNDDRRPSNQDTRFLDLEMSKVLYDEAQQVTREAFRELLLDAAKKRFVDRFGAQIEGLANLAVDELVDDMLANLEIERLIASRGKRDKAVATKVREILRAENDESDDDD